MFPLGINCNSNSFHLVRNYTLQFSLQRFSLLPCLAVWRELWMGRNLSLYYPTYFTHKLLLLMLFILIFFYFTTSISEVIIIIIIVVTTITITCVTFWHFSISPPLPSLLPPAPLLVPRSVQLTLGSTLEPQTAEGVQTSRWWRSKDEGVRKREGREGTL